MMTSSDLPGWRLLALASRWFAPDVVARFFEPLVADWQQEFAATAGARRRLASIRGHVAFVATFAMMTPRLAVAPVPATLTRRLILHVGGFLLFGIALGLTPFIVDGIPLAFLYLLLPATITMVLPFAMGPGVDAIRCRTDWSAHHERQTVFKLVAIATLWMVIGGGWLVPYANQRWRNEMMSAQQGRPTVASRGLRELTTTELVTGGAARLPALNGTPRVREVMSRLSISVLPLLLAWMRWRTLDQGSKGWGKPLPASVIAAGAATGFILLRNADSTVEAFFLAPGFGPLISVGLLTMALFSAQLSRRLMRATP